MNILQGDVRDVLKILPAQSVHTCVTSPPYWGLRDYGAEGQLGLEQTPEEYVSNMVEVFREVRRVLRDDGTLWLNLGDSYFGGGSTTAYANDSRNFSGSTLQSKHTEGQNTRPIKPRQHVFLKPKDLVGIPWRVAFALQADGWYLRSDIIWHKPNPMPESVTDRPTKAHEYIFLLSKSEKYYYDHEAIKEPSARPGEKGVFGGSGGFRPKETDPNYRGENGSQWGNVVETKENRNKRTVWTVATKPFPEAHFATYPPDLIEPCILAGCPVGGTVLDPFNGSGTTGLVAMQNNREYIGIELNPEYIEISKRRLASIQTRLF